MKKTLQLNRGLYIATLVLGICSFVFNLVIVFYQMSFLNDGSYASTNAFNWMRISFSAAAAISLIIISTILLLSTKDKNNGGRDILKLIDLYTAIQGGGGVLIYGFSLVEIASFSGTYFFNMLLNMFFCVFGVVALLFIDKNGNVNKILALIESFLLAAFSLQGVFGHPFNIRTIDSLLILAYLTLTVVSIFMMKEKGEEEPSSNNEQPKSESLK